MSTVTVFVDDAVQGHLPMIGVTDGAPAEGLHRIDLTIGSPSGWLWLLIFLGPIGWIVLLALAAFGSGRRFTVRLPSTRAALRHQQMQLRAAVAAGLVLAASVIAWIVAMAGPSPRSNVRETLVVLLGATAVAALIATLVFAVRYSWARPGIDLDASGRWVTLSGVHPAFASACADAARRNAPAPTRT
jgi:hypothetical protein